MAAESHEYLNARNGYGLDYFRTMKVLNTLLAVSGLVILAIAAYRSAAA